MYPNLIIALERKNITQAVLAAHIGVTPKTLTNKMTGRSDWNLGECRKVASLLGYSSIDDLFLYEEKESEK